ncbi:MAG: N-formylglutamate amidohydrolase [Rhodospirillales bacterium]
MTVPSLREPFLGESDGPAFRTVNETAQRPLLLICDHASNVVPRSLDSLGLPAHAFDEHIAYDLGAARLTERLAARLGCMALLAGFSRLVIDVNRQPGDPGSIPPVSDGWEIPANRDLSEACQERRTEALFRPYHNAITEALAHLWRNGPPPALFSVHSFTPVFGGKADRPWHAGVLWNRDPRIAVPLLHHLREPGDKVIGDNEPYSGKLIAYSIDRHGAAGGLPNAAIEVRQDQLATEAGIEDWAVRIGSGLEALMSDPHLHKVEHF